MGALFSAYGVAAGNSEIIKWVASLAVDVVLMPAVLVVFLYDVVRVFSNDGTSSVADKVFVVCLALVFCLLAIWSLAWATGSYRLVLISPEVLTAVSTEFNEQSTKIMDLRTQLGARATNDSVNKGYQDEGALLEGTEKIQ
jgi:hypothetical protein